LIDRLDPIVSIEHNGKLVSQTSEYAAADD
jgi:hypothetical protein